MIEISHLVKKYGDHIAVNDLTLTVEPGKIYGFLGPNGAGKSTTMNIITGYLGATSGEVKINGFDIFAQPEEAKKCAVSSIEASQSATWRSSFLIFLLSSFWAS